MKDTKIINIYGGPCAGKTTAASGVFCELKKLGYDCGLVAEMATELVYDEAYKVMKDQLYLFANQYHRTYRMLGKVDFIVTDSPFLMNVVYDSNKDEDFKKFWSLKNITPRWLKEAQHQKKEIKKTEVEKYGLWDILPSGNFAEYLVD